MSDKVLTPRAMTLTDADLKALTALLRQESHECRFENITKEDMDFIKDLLGIYKETRSEVIKWLVRGVVYGAVVLACVVGYFKLKH